MTYTEIVDTTEVILSVTAGLIVLVIGFALKALVDMVGSRLDDMRVDIGNRFGDLTGRMDNLESRLNGMDASLAMIHKDLGEVVGWVRAHGPLHQTG